MRSMISTALPSRRLLTLIAAATMSALPVAAMAKDNHDNGRRDDHRAPAARVDSREAFRQWNHDDDRRGGDEHDRDDHDREYRNHDDHDRDRDAHARVGVQIGGHDEDRVWVEPVYRTVCDQVYVPAEYRTVTDHVWIAPVTQKVSERVWIEPKYEARPVDPFGRIHAVEKVQVKPGHYEDVCRDVVVTPGCYQDVQRQELVCDAHYTSVERQELLTPGHWETRGHDRDGFALNLRLPIR